MASDLRHRSHGVVVIQGGVGAAVQQALCRCELAAVDAEGVRIGFALVVVARLRTVCRHALGKVDQLQWIADIERRVLHKLAFDDVAAVGRIGHQFRRRGRNRDCLRVACRRKLQIERACASHLQLHFLQGELSKPDGCRMQYIAARRHWRNQESIPHCLSGRCVSSLVTALIISTVASATAAPVCVRHMTTLTPTLCACKALTQRQAASAMPAAEATAPRTVKPEIRREHTNCCKTRREMPQLHAPTLCHSTPAVAR